MDAYFRQMESGVLMTQHSGTRSKLAESDCGQVIKSLFLILTFLRLKTTRKNKYLGLNKKNIESMYFCQNSVIFLHTHLRDNFYILF
jgi:hypothetical protein